MLQFTRESQNYWLVCRCSITQDLIIAQRIASLPTGIAGVTFDGINSAIFHLFHDAHMIGEAIGAAGFFFIPVEEDNHARCGLDVITGPLSSLLEPVDAVDTACEFGNDTGIDIAALVGAPGNETGAPLNTAAETIPGPIGLSTDVSHLRKCYGDDGIITGADAVSVS